MNRIKNKFEELSSNNSKALITYTVAGDPDLDTTLSIMNCMAEEGADIIEIGIPFSDPMAEGVSIQRGHERALLNKVSIKDSLSLVSKFRKSNKTTPVVFMGYMNPFESMGVKHFCKAAASNGVDGILIVDMPPEESTEFSIEAKNNGIDVIRLIAPTTDISRAKEICGLSSGYIYYISVKGITGSNDLDSEDVKEKVGLLSNETDLPIAIGFGIKDSKSALSVKDLADGIVAGSVFVDLISEGGDTISKIASKTKELSIAIK
jgi:tryptophan synthase alpha chain